jgi:hypothetical protein
MAEKSKPPALLVVGDSNLAQLAEKYFQIRSTDFGKPILQGSYQMLALNPYAS